MSKFARFLSVVLVAVLFTCMFAEPALAATKKTVAVKSVKLDKTACTLKVNATLKLKATVNPSNATSKKITWSSSNSKVAKVNQSGVVTAVAKGKATITAKAGNGKKATCTVTVVEVPVTKVTLNKSSVETRGKTKLTATVAPKDATKKTLTWSSSNTKVATVDKNGNVTPVGYGTATITAQSANGKKASCKVTVKRDVTFRKSYTVAESGPYKMIDTFVVVVDGITGKIKSTDCYQTKGDLTIIIGATATGRGIKAYNKQDTYVDFRSTWSLSLSIGLGDLKISSGDTVTRTNSYRMHNDGSLELINGSCTDMLNLCKR